MLLLLGGAPSALAGPLLGIIGTPPSFSLSPGPYVGDSGIQNNPPTEVNITTTGLLTPIPSQKWAKDIVWNYAGGSISPGDRLCIREVIVLYNQSQSAPLQFLADWHETIVDSTVLLEWEEDTATMEVRYGVTPLPVTSTTMISKGGREIWLSFAPPLAPDIYAGATSTPTVLDIRKYVKYTGNTVITSGGSQTELRFRIIEQPSAPEPSALSLAATCVAVLAARRRRPA
jgi:hypothetical protein